MLKEILQHEFPELITKMRIAEGEPNQTDLELAPLFIEIYKLLLGTTFDKTSCYERIAEAYHLKGDLREAASYYSKVLEQESPEALTIEDKQHVFQYAPKLLVNAKECFDLLDVVAIHHPTESLICYHLFWEDDYDYPDDYEPCDHEQVWVRYQEKTSVVLEVSSFLHGRVIKSEEAVHEANENNGQPIIRIEWGKHGSLLCGWENMIDPISNRPFQEVMQETYGHVARGGRSPHHPLKRWWPDRFDGTFEEYLTFSKKIDTKEYLIRKQMMMKSNWSNAVLQQYFLRYNFHPKFDWPF